MTYKDPGCRKGCAALLSALIALAVDFGLIFFAIKAFLRSDWERGCALVALAYIASAHGIKTIEETFPSPHPPEENEPR